MSYLPMEMQELAVGQRVLAPREPDLPDDLELGLIKSLANDLCTIRFDDGYLRAEVPLAEVTQADVHVTHSIGAEGEQVHSTWCLATSTPQIHPNPGLRIDTFPVLTISAYSRFLP